MTPGRALAALVVVPSFWLLVEWIRSWQALGGPWALLGASQWQHPAILALAPVGGVWLVSFALVAANTGIVILRHRAAAGTVARSGRRGGGGRDRRRARSRSRSPRRSHPPDYVTVALVQPGYLQHNSALRHGRQPTAVRRAGPAAPGPDRLGGEQHRLRPATRITQLLDQLERLSGADGAQILVNQDSLPPAGKSKVAVLISPHGIVATYTKTRLVPFGEYIPFRQQLGWLTSISKAAPSNMIPGTGRG